MAKAVTLTGGAAASKGYKPAHHPSHSGLLYRPVRPSHQAHVDAIVVPTIRRAVVLQDALQLGERLGRPVIALCSGWSTPHRARALAESFSTELIAVDLTQGIESWPEFRTATTLGKRFRHKSDLSLKRNLGLALARMAGWQRLVFLDDDITDVDPQDIKTAAALVDTHLIVTLENVGYPDNSVVCHALRRLRRVVGFAQDSFVGGGAMVVAANRIDSFFPNIYNEDWFFMLGVLNGESPKQIAAIGKAAQQSYDPFLSPERARIEELGDSLGEGLYALLDDGIPLSAAMEIGFWEAFLGDRGGLLERLLAGVDEVRMDLAERTKLVDSLKAALGVHKLITPQLCVDYMRAWSEDRRLWSSYLTGLPAHVGLQNALSHLGLSSYPTRGFRSGDI